MWDITRALLGIWYRCAECCSTPGALVSRRRTSKDTMGALNKESNDMGFPHKGTEQGSSKQCL